MKKLLIILACVALFLAGHAQAAHTRLNPDAYGGEIIFLMSIPLALTWSEKDGARKTN